MSRELNRINSISCSAASEPVAAASQRQTTWTFALFGATGLLCRCRELEWPPRIVLSVTLSTRTNTRLPLQQC